MAAHHSLQRAGMPHHIAPPLPLLASSCPATYGSPSPQAPVRPLPSPVQLVAGLLGLTAAVLLASQPQRASTLVARILMRPPTLQLAASAASPGSLLAQHHSRLLAGPRAPLTTTRRQGIAPEPEQQVEWWPAPITALLGAAVATALALAHRRLSSHSPCAVHMAMASVSGSQAAPHELSPLPYDKAALQPQISSETLEYHHGRHHQAYVTRLNELLQAEENAAWRGKSIEELVLGTQGSLFNQAAQIWNHDFYWRCLRANPDGAPNPPTGVVKDLIDRDFGTFEQFQAQFTATCTGHFGSGWVWLVYGQDKKLAIVQGHDAGNPLRDGVGIPILTCDVWEHAYYIDHRNLRAAYVAKWWQLVNWEFANDTLGVRQMAMASTTGAP
eukprot:GGOE01058287.1.p1 GENE.GGOE01058287.1~~GGOE01058287.1.p1  ORF type:complete len:386 (+),score=88.85 GGOE01058287.1:60-1217(+)